MKRKAYNLVFLTLVVVAAIWLNLPEQQDAGRHGPRGYKSYILAVSWQPAFCESKPNKPECRSQRKGRHDTLNFSLHGLWPQPRENTYCGVPKHIIEADKRGRWNELPKLELQGRFRNELARRMPGYRSNLHRHEWYKHGTCMGEGTTPQRYYELSLSFIDDLNKTALRDLFVQNIGKELTATQIVRAIERAYGKGAGKRIGISCKRDGKRTLITELKISYSYKTGTGTLTSTAENIQSAPKIPIGCKRGIVDAVGLQ